MVQSVPRRAESPDRWRAALERAIAAGVEPLQLGDGSWVVTSATRIDLAYRTDGTTCECEAAMLGADQVCQHRAVVRFVRGLLTLDPEPKPAPTVRPLARQYLVPRPAA